MSVTTKASGVVVTLEDRAGDTLVAEDLDGEPGRFQLQMINARTVYATVQDLREFAAGLLALANTGEAEQ